jgi:hypothetical protein
VFSGKNQLSSSYFFSPKAFQQKKKAIISRKTKKVDEPKGSGPKSSDLRLLTPLARPAILSMHL